MSNRRHEPILLPGVDPADIVALAPDYEAFCKSHEREWDSKNRPFVAFWDAEAELRMSRHRWERYQDFINPLAIQWWADRGFAVSIGREGKLTIGKVEEVAAP